jgi:hypothetical protein
MQQPFFKSMPATEKPTNLTAHEDLTDSEEESYYSVSETWSKITADIDSMAMLSTFYNNLIDCVGKTGSIWYFTNIIRRTKADNGGRIKLHFGEGIDRPRFSRRAMNGFPTNWFPNMELCTINTDSGLSLHINYYLIGHGNFRSCHFLTKIELCVMTSAMNYARKAGYALEKTTALICKHDLNEDYGSFVGDFEQFVGQVGNNRKKDRLHVYEKQHAVFGRIFLQSVFEALKLFADDITKAMKPDETPLFLQVNDPKFHGVEDTRPTVENFQEVAHYLYYKGMLLANTAGTKKSFDKLPQGRVDLSDNVAVKWFLEEAINTLKGEFGHYVDSAHDRVSKRRRTFLGSTPKTPTLSNSYPFILWCFRRRKNQTNW